MPDNVVTVIIDGRNDSSPALQAATAEIDALRARADQLGAQMLAAGAKTGLAGNQMSFSMQNARGSAALLGEEVGIHIPRHIATFLAGLPGVGVAMSAAFSGVALIGLIELLVKAADKATLFVQSLLPSSDALARINAAMEQMTVDVTAQASAQDKLQKLQAAFSVIGLPAYMAIKQQLSDVDKQIAAIAASAASATPAIQAMQQATSNFIAPTNMLAIITGGFFGGTPDSKASDAAIGEQKTANAALLALLEQLNQQKLNLTTSFNLAKQQADEAAAAKSLALAQATGQSILSADHKSLAAELDLAIAYAKLDYAEGQTSGIEENLLIAAANEAKYQNDLDYENRKLSLLKSGKNENAVRDQNAKIEAMQTEHLAKEMTEYADFLVQLGQMRMTLPDFGAPILSSEAQAIQNLADAYAHLGIVSTAALREGLTEAQKDYALIRASGTVSLGDILQAQMKVLQAQIAINASLGAPVAADTTQLKQLQAQYEALSGTVQKESPEIKHLVSSVGNDFGNFLSNFSDSSKTAAQDFTDFGRSILKTIDDMAGKFIASHILDYFGQMFASFGGGGLSSGGFGFGDTSMLPGGLKGFDSGGSVSAGQTVMVGESGIELFTPETAGSIIPNNMLRKMGSTTHLTQYFDLRGSSGITQQDLHMMARVVEERSVARAKVEMREFNLRRV